MRQQIMYNMEVIGSLFDHQMEGGQTDRQTDRQTWRKDVEFPGGSQTHNTGLLDKGSTKPLGLC